MDVSPEDISTEVANLKRQDELKFVGTIANMEIYMFMVTERREWEDRKKDIMRYVGDNFDILWEHVLRGLLINRLALIDFMLMAKSKIEWEGRKDSAKEVLGKHFRYMWFVSIVGTGLSVKAIVEMKKPVSEQVWPLEV